jgi:hypothetical protein
MGFNVSVHSNLPDEAECHHFVDRAYYVFVVTYENFRDRSVVAQLGEALGVNIIPLCKLVYGFGINPAKKYWQDAEKASIMIESLRTNPAIVDAISIPYPQDDNFFAEYIRSGELVEHLIEILRTIKCLTEKGATSIFFLAG